MVYAKFTHALTNVTTNPVTQWDYGRTLRIDGLDLPTAVRIDFGISGEQTTISRIGTTKDRVTAVVIPDSFLEQSNNLVAYVYVNDTTEGKTVRTINIPITARAKPEEFDTPESKELFAEAIEQLNDAADRAETARDEAKGSADQAKASEETTAAIAEAFTETAESAVSAVNEAGVTNTRAINEKGAEAVSAVNTAGETQKQAVQKAGTDAVSEIETKKQEVINAGNNAIENISTAKAEALTEIQTELEAQSIENAGLAIVCEAEGESIVLRDSAKARFRGMRIFGKSTQDGTPTPDAPVDIISVESASAILYGKNLLNVDEHFAFTGIPGFDVYFPAGVYVLSFESESHAGEKPPEFRFYDNKIWNTIDENNKVKTVTLTKPETKIYIYSNGTSNANSTGVSASIEKLMLSKVGGDYEPHKEPQTITLPHTLPGIPVESGGNYTDANGQQWICDEIDLARGVKVQRIQKLTLNGTEANWDENTVASEVGVVAYQLYNNTFNATAKHCLCSHFQNGGQWAAGVSAVSNLMWIASANVMVFKTDGEQSLDDFKAWLSEQNEAGTPVSVLYLLSAPIETPLSEAEFSAYKALLSNKPTTTLINDSGAYMAVSYVADTKIYIDNKIKEILEGA